MKYAIIFLSSFLLAGCAASDFSDTASSRGVNKAPLMNVTKPFVANAQVMALNAQLQQAYSNHEAQVLRVGNEIKVTYPSDVLFGVGGEALLPSSQAVLDPLIAAVKAYPRATVRMDGFTDNSGSQESNVTHSEGRAQSVARYLIGDGLAADKMSLKGYGSDDPVASNDTPEGRAQNRRIVITIKVPEPVVVPTPAPQAAA